MCVCPVTPRSNSYVYVEGRGDGGNQNLSRNISRNIPFRAGNQLLEIYIRGLEILILAKWEACIVEADYGRTCDVRIVCDGIICEDVLACRFLRTPSGRRRHA